MPVVTMTFALVLVGLGVGAYVMTGMRSWTALIPSIAGVLLFVCGLIAQKPEKRKHAMHAAVLVAILGFAGTVPGVIKTVQMYQSGISVQRPANLADDQVQLNNGKIVRPAAIKVQTAMAAVLLPYIVICVKSFVDARRMRTSLP